MRGSTGLIERAVTPAHGRGRTAAVQIAGQRWLCAMLGLMCSHKFLSGTPDQSSCSESAFVQPLTRVPTDQRWWPVGLGPGAPGSKLPTEKAVSNWPRRGGLRHPVAWGRLSSMPIERAVSIRPGATAYGRGRTATVLSAG